MIGFGLQYWIWIIGLGYFEEASNVVTQPLWIHIRLGRDRYLTAPLDSPIGVNMALRDRICGSTHDDRGSTHRHCGLTHHHRGPLIVVVVGIGFGVVGAIPVAVNYAVGATNSGTIIGVGFIGFGLLLVVPGLVWCIVQRLLMLKRCCECCRCGSRRDSVVCLEETAASSSPVFISKQSRCSAVDTSFSIIRRECLKEEFHEDDNTSAFISIDAPERSESSR